MAALAEATDWSWQEGLLLAFLRLRRLFGDTRGLDVQLLPEELEDSSLSPSLRSSSSSSPWIASSKMTR
jgi:hypothetical protein